MIQRHALFLVAVFLLGGCGLFGKKDEQFKAGSRPAKPLEVPPELTTPGVDDRFAIPDPRSQTTYSAYQQRANTPAPAASPSGPAVLPKIEGARIERVGDQRWLVVQ
ncbi:MAG TPA: hypothetical protein VHQ02_02640, partial [Usitatibacter sp.]|nr:hypothetical protein [Usitatibacter sp.]